MKVPGNPDSRGGFTLLEVLIAIAIFAICISTVYGLYSSVTSVVQNVEQQAAEIQRVGVTLKQVNRDLEGLYRGKQGVIWGRQSETGGSDDPFLEFVSSSHLSFSPEAPVVSRTLIRYYLRRDANDDSAVLLRSDSPVAVSMDESEDSFESRKLALFEGLSEVKLTFFGPDNEELTEWDSRRNEELDEEAGPIFPTAVSLTLVLADDTVPISESKADAYSTAVYLRPAILEFPDGGAR